MLGCSRYDARLLLAFAVAGVLAVFVTPRAEACKQRLDPSTYPVEDLANFDTVYLVEITSVSPLQPLAESWYAPPFTFEAKVLRTFKGVNRTGDLIQGATGTNEEPAARCPIYLREGVTYLIVLNGTESPFTLPRYSAYVPSSDGAHFKRYLRDVEKYYSSNGAR
jgi:hypothetical protein